MKKIVPVLISGIFIWGCAKKMTPAQTETSPPAANTGSVINNTAKPAETNTGTGSAGANTPTGSTGTEGVKTAPPRERSAAETAAIAGQATFNAKCGRCHGLKPAGDYTATRWANILAVMAPRANLTEEERNNVYEYVKANSKK
ncbi:MAG: cytochrome c [Chitinophagaceae bacterium]|nr:cytochrome c [Chitinophagaceae bacterium]